MVRAKGSALAPWNNGYRPSSGFNQSTCLRDGREDGMLCLPGQTAQGPRGT